MAGAEQAVMEEGWPIFIPSTDDKWGQFHSKNYPVTEQSRLNRVALLINNQRFDDHKDEHNMLDLLQNLQYEVVKYNRLTAQEIGDALIKFSSHPKLPLTDSVFVVIMSNGDSRVLFGIDHEEFKIDHIYEHLNTKNCPALLNKPKVIIIQSCSEGKQRPMMRDRGSTDIKQAKSSVLVKDPLVHKERDFISIVSCTSHTVYKSPRYGSSFIQDIVEVFNTFSQDEHIEVLFKKVMEGYEEDRTEMVTIGKCTLTKYFYLFPGDSEVIMDSHTADAKPTELMKFPSFFSPEVRTESGVIIYRFRFPGSGLFQCSVTGLIFDITQETMVLYRIIQWNENLLQTVEKTPAGPLYDIKGCENAVRQLHFPHCETEEALLSGGSLSVIHFYDNKMKVLKPLEITDTHVIVEVSHLSDFGIVQDFIMSFWNNTTAIKGQVLLFLRQPYPETKVENVDVLLLPRNIPLQEVRAQHPDSNYIPVASNCELIKNQTYTVHCPMSTKIQPKKAKFDMEFGPNYYATFVIRFAINTEEITVTVRTGTDTEVWEHDVDLTAVRRSLPVTSSNLQELHQRDHPLDISTAFITDPSGRNVPLKQEDKNHLLSILKDLNDEDYGIFKWHLKSLSWNGIEPIKEDQLSKAERHESVDLMVSKYRISVAVQVMESILQKIPREDLVAKLRC